MRNTTSVVEVVVVAPHPAQASLLSTGVTLTSDTMMQRRAIRTCRRFGTHTCSVSNDASHNHKDNNGGHHAASTPFPMPRVIRVSHCSIVGVSVCHGEPPDIPYLKKERRLSTAFPASDDHSRWLFNPPA